MSRRPGEAGFVLPAVLAILLVIAAAAAAATQAMQTRLGLVASHVGTLHLQGIADGVARLVSVSLLTEHGRKVAGLGLPENGAPVACTLAGGIELRIAVQDQAGLIDLNTSPRPLLEDAFRAIGLADRDAMTIAAEIVDDRDPDDEPEPNGGAEAPQYKARGLAYGPRNAPLASIDELDLLPSMTEAIAALLRPAVTVDNPSGGFDPSLAPSPALAAADALRPFVLGSPHRFYEVHVVARDAAATRAGRAARLTLGAQTLGPGLLEWRATVDEPPGARPHPACGLIRAALDLAE